MKKANLIFLLLILSTSSIASMQLIGGDGTDDFIQVCEKIGGDGTDKDIGGDGTDAPIGGDGTDMETGGDGTDAPNNNQVCYVVNIKK